MCEVGTEYYVGLLLAVLESVKFGYENYKIYTKLDTEFGRFTGVADSRNCVVRCRS